MEFVTYTLQPWVRQFELEVRLKLFKEVEKKTKFLRFNMNTLLRGDTQARADFYRVMQSGILTANEMRELEGYNPIDGGDELLVPLNTAPIKDVGSKSDM